MAAPVGNSVPLVGNAFIDGLVQGGSWTFAGAPTFTYSFSINDTPGNQPAWTPGLVTAFVQALTAWSDVANITFVESGSGTVFTQSSADIAVTLTGNELQQFLGAIALGIFPDPAYVDDFISDVGYDRMSYPRAEGDLFFDNFHLAFQNLQPGGVGLAVMLHESGHALGLKHTNDDGGNSRPTFAAFGIASFDNQKFTVMNSTGLQGPAFPPPFPATPMPLDILAIQRIYGPNNAFHIGDDVYALQNATAYRTIWDAGGTDTLDASALPFLSGFNPVIDLNGGAYSGISPVSSLTAIAYNVVIENAIGSVGNDTITGNAADNVLSGGDGDDTISGGDGNDVLNGGTGTNALNGGNGSDTIVAGLSDAIDGGAGIDTVQTAFGYMLPGSVENLLLTGSDNLGGAGNALDNVLTGNSGVNMLTGGLGNDTYIVQNVGDVAVENAGEGTDTVQSSITFTLGAEVENLLLTGADAIDGTGNALANAITGNAGSNVLDGGPGADSLNGGAGFDSVSYATAGSGITAFLNAGLGAGSGGDAQGDLYTGIEGVSGSNFADVLVGNHASVLGIPNTLHGGGGDDVIYGEGVDGVTGGDGSDVFFGGSGGAINLNLATAGIETVWGSVANDTLDGFTAAMPLVFIGAPGADTMSGGSGSDFLYYDNFDTVSGGLGSDWAVATLSGAGVTLNLNATGFENTWGSPYNDTLSGAGSASTVVIVGDVGNDTITGGNTFDFLYGFGGDDTLMGGPGGDVMLGGLGNDRYAYVNPSEGFDSIFDFDTGSDKFQFTAVNFGKNPGDALNGTNFKAGAAPSSTHATPTWLYDTGTGILTFDQDGIGAMAPSSIAQIFLAPAVAASDILFV